MGGHGSDRDDDIEWETDNETPEEREARLLREQGEMNHRISRDTRNTYITQAHRIISGVPEDWRD